MSDTSNTLTRRQAMRIGATVAVSTFMRGSPAFAAGAAAPLRKNIDSLSTDELANYKHAVGIIIQRGSANPSAQDGYVWQADLHNDFERERCDGSEGACEHRSELFFPWHRAHLAGFEFLLRAADPPRTAKVTIPYWDWTQEASGARFPKAFEDRASPLFHDVRYHDVSPGRPRIKWDAEEIKRFVQETVWFRFSGNPLNPDGTGGSQGWVEGGPHNPLHGSIGPRGGMGHPFTAAKDPIYWSFHTYIDLIWARWQRIHTDAAHPQPFSTPRKKICVEPFIPVVGDMAQIDTLPAGYAYGYDYDFSIDGAPMIVAGGPAPEQRTLSEVTSGERMSTISPLRVQGSKRRLLFIRDVAVLQDVTYSISAYVHPPTVNIQSVAQGDRDRYLADTATIWMSGRHAHYPTNVYLDLTKAIASFGGGEFAISLLTETLPLPQSAAEIESVRPSLNAKLTASGPLWRSLVLEEH